ncbi:MAG: hypothetical protein E6F98_08190 [Actinobacteria bacterium]|nr:MAG: hypothetical protein E6F98_08190 [Actinomycetota bacterium]
MARACCRAGLEHRRSAPGFHSMTETVQVEAARIPDRDRLLQELRDAGRDARPVDEVCIEVPCGDVEQACDDLLALAEDAIMSIGAPFVPMKHDGTIYIRPRRSPS